MNKFFRFTNNVKLGKKVKLSKFINLYGCRIGDNTKIGAFVEIQKGVVIGKNCKISSHSFICSGVTIGNNCFIGHGVMFINDNYPRALNQKGRLEKEKEWQARFVKTLVGNNVSIGSNVTILGGLTVGVGSVIGAGSVVTKNVSKGQIWVGNPAKFQRLVKQTKGNDSSY